MPFNEKTTETAARSRLSLALLGVGLAVFGLSSFELGWMAFRWANIITVCGPPPSGLCLESQLPLSSFVFFILVEIAATIFMGFTLYRVIHSADVKIQELEDRLRQSQAKPKGEIG